MTRKIVDVAVIIPDASPVLTLARVGRIDLLGTFAVPIKIVDQVHDEITRPENDPRGDIAVALHRLHNHIEIVETNVGAGFRARRARGEDPSSRNLGEIAVDEYATSLAHSSGPGFVPLVLFEDPDVLELRIARLTNVHLLNTTAWLMTLHREGLAARGAGTGRSDQCGAQDPHGAFRTARIDQKSAIDLAAAEFWTMNEDLKGCSLADVLDKLEKGKIGHRAAMAWLNIESQNELVEIMHFNGRLMPGHQPMRVAPETRALLRTIARPSPR